MPDYSLIDVPSLLRYLFYPRKDFTASPKNAFDLKIQVDQDVFVCCRFYAGDKNWPWILYFHGNGEVVSDYNEIAPLYYQYGLNLVVTDYRGYGASGGTPTFPDLIKDAHSIFKAIKEELISKGLQQNFLVMGRSLGSIPALELAYHYQDKIRGMIIESGFACVTRLISRSKRASQGTKLIQLEQECLEMVNKIYVPSLIIHGQQDSLVPLVEGELLYNQLGTSQKQLVVIPDADHNNIMFVGFNLYFDTIQRFIYG